MLTYSCKFVIWRCILCLPFWILFVIMMITLNRGSSYRGSVPYILLLLWTGWRKSFVVPRTLLYWGLSNWGPTVTRLLIGGLNCTALYCNFQLLTRDMDLHGWLGTVKELIEFDNIQPQNDHTSLIIGIWSVQSSCPGTGRLKKNIVKIKYFVL